MLKLLYDNIKLIIIALIAIIVVFMIVIMLSLSYGGDTIRTPYITEITGAGSISQGSKRISALKKSKIKSGDIIAANEGSSIRIMIDDDKYITIEENSSVGLYYTEVSGKGSIEVSISEGAVICQLDNPLKENSFFKVKTPNSAVDVRGTVFRVDFDYAETYMGYEDVYITEVQNFSGSVNIQLYDLNKEAVDSPMLLIERTSAKMISAADVSQYIYLNHDTDMFGLTERAILELIRISVSNGLAYSPDELNTAHKAIVRNKYNSITDSSVFSVSEEETASTASGTSASVTTEPPDTVSSAETSRTQPGTLATTRQTHVYTTFSGEKWWEIINPNPEADDNSGFDDGGVSEQFSAVTEINPDNIEGTYFMPS